MTKEGLKKCDMRWTAQTLPALRMEEEGHVPRNLEAGKGEEMNVLLESPERSL